MNASRLVLYLGTWRDSAPNRKTRPTSRELCGFFTFHKWKKGKWANNQLWKRKDDIRLLTGQPYFSLESSNRSFFIGLSMFYLRINYITSYYASKTIFYPLRILPAPFILCLWQSHGKDNSFLDLLLFAYLLSSWLSALSSR